MDGLVGGVRAAIRLDASPSSSSSASSAGPRSAGMREARSVTRDTPPQPSYHRTVARHEFLRAVDRFRTACAEHPLVVAAFLGGSYAAGTERDDSDIDVYVVTRQEDYDTFVAGRRTFMESWGHVVWSEDVWNFEQLGFDMIRFRHADGVWGEVALGHAGNFMALHGGPHRVLVDKPGLLDGVTFPLL